MDVIPSGVAPDDELVPGKGMAGEGCPQSFFKPLGYEVNGATPGRGAKFPTPATVPQ